RNNHTSGVRKLLVMLRSLPTRCETCSSEIRRVRLLPARCARYGEASRPRPHPRGFVMLVVMHSHATAEQIDQVLAAVREMNLTPHPMPGATRTAIGITGNLSAVDPRTLEVLPGVFE